MQRDLTWVVLHEIGHVNMAYLDEGKDRYAHFKWDAHRSEMLNGWDRAMPLDLQQAVAAITRPQESHSADAGPPEPLSASQANGKAVKHVRALYWESYADTFSILSVAAKDGRQDALAMAEKILDFRAAKRGVASAQNDHDSTRGLEWLIAYLRAPAGQRLVEHINQASCNSECSQRIHETSLLFSEVNLRRWARSNGMEPSTAERLSLFVGDYYRVGLRDPQPDPGLAKQPTVYAHDMESIRQIGATALGQKEPVHAIERVLERGYGRDSPPAVEASKNGAVRE